MKLNFILTVLFEMDKKFIDRTTEFLNFYKGKQKGVISGKN